MKLVGKTEEKKPSPPPVIGFALPSGISHDPTTTYQPEPLLSKDVIVIQGPSSEEMRTGTKSKKKADLPDYVIRILAKMWINSHTRAKNGHRYSTETDLYQQLDAWLTEHPL